MCLQWMKIRSVNYHSSKEMFVPCGKCEECRNMERSSWEFRLRAEVDEYVYRLGWQMGFITLTYNEQNLPYLPAECFKGYDPLYCSSPNYRPIPCFNKEHIRSLIHGLRKWINKAYGCKRLIYMVATEFGESTKRPHYHACFVFPKEVPARDFYNAIRDLWTAEENVIKQPRRLKGKSCVLATEKMRRNLGFVCPRVFEGYGREKPFLVCTGDAFKAAKYAAKYVCKDLYYMEQLPADILNFGKSKIADKVDFEYNDEIGVEEYEAIQYADLPTIRNYLPFHFQTRSLGSGILQNADNARLLEIYKHGIHFVGSETAKPQAAPAYIKNKIVFTPYYVVDSDGRRLVRRQASQFFNENYKEIFDKKVNFYEEAIDKLSNRNYYIGCNCSIEQADEWSKEVSNIVEYLGGSRSLAEQYLCYYGVGRDKCYVEEDRALVYLNHYFPIDGLDNSDVKILDYDYYVELQDGLSIIFGLLKFTAKMTKTEEERLLDMVADYHKHLDESVFAESGYIKESTDYVF